MSHLRAHPMGLSYALPEPGLYGCAVPVSERHD